MKEVRAQRTVYKRRRHVVGGGSGDGHKVIPPSTTIGRQVMKYVAGPLFFKFHKL
jgi:hypothetical protein